MYKVDAESKRISKLLPRTFTELGLLERFDIQEWIAGSPEILGEDLLVIAKEHELPSRIRIDLLAVDKNANLVIVELKRDESGSAVEWQAIKYASYCSNFTTEDVFAFYARYLHCDIEEART
jgi:RecB family endonuclease NucS